jgi:hypothetical protein
MRFFTVDSEIACIRKNGSNAEFFVKVGGSINGISRAQTFTNGVWYYMVGTYLNGTATIYINGVQLGATQSITGTLDSSVNYKVSSEAAFEAMVGNIANILVYNRALSATEVLQNYYAGLQRFIPTSTTTLCLDGENTNTRVIIPTTAYDTGVNLTNGTLMNSLLLSHRNAGTSFSFDGTNNYIDCGSLSNLAPTFANLTVSVWFKISAAQGGTAGVLIKFGASNAGWSIGIGSTNLVTILYSVGGMFLQTGVPISLNVWHNATFTYNGSVFEVYLDGVSVSSSALYPGSITTGGSYVVNIGRDGSTGTNYFAGNISIVRVFSQTLTATDVLNIYNAGKPRHGL